MVVSMHHFKNGIRIVVLTLLGPTWIDAFLNGILHISAVDFSFFIGALVLLSGVLGSCGAGKRKGVSNMRQGLKSTDSPTGGQMIRQKHELILVALAVLGALLYRMLGRRIVFRSFRPGKSVYWAAPQYFTDNTPLVPSRDLQGYEIYIKQDSSFGPADSAVATPSPLDTAYNLANVSPPLIEGGDLLRFHADGRRWRA